MAIIGFPPFEESEEIGIYGCANEITKNEKNNIREIRISRCLSFCVDRVC
jgi:hypothetical protein